MAARDAAGPRGSRHSARPRPPSRLGEAAKAPKLGPGSGASAAGLVQVALRQESHLDFPRITEICDRLEGHPVEVPAAVGVLAAALCDPAASLARKLKALTISNEAMYSAEAVAAFRSTEGLRQALVELAHERDSNGPAFHCQDVAVENVRMLATEVWRACFAGIAVVDRAGEAVLEHEDRPWDIWGRQMQKQQLQGALSTTPAEPSYWRKDLAGALTATGWCPFPSSGVQHLAVGWGLILEPSMTELHRPVDGF